MENFQLPQQNTFSFDYFDPNNRLHKITFNSVFDSGNLRQVFCSSPDTYIVYTAPDCCGMPHEGSQKNWFYFGVKGVPLGSTLNFVIKKISILASLIPNKLIRSQYKSAPDMYKPVYKVGKDSWKRIENQALIQEDPVEKTLDVKFSHTFFYPNEEIFFAFTYPFSYEENQQLLENYDKVYQKDPDIYYHHEIIIRSPQDRAIDLLTISSHEGKIGESESLIDENLFPGQQPRAQKFRDNKPVILITSRVHPGETPSSHTMNGIMKFLLDKKDIRAQLLRSYFVFLLMPIINPDGVANGHYRMDIFNQNLNRYYKNPDLKKQPSIYAVRKLVEYLYSENRLFFYCDLHAHAAKKGCFLYGNALDFVMQVESILYTKVLGLNCVNFEQESCNFSEKHMKARDKGEKLTKEGAARVCVYKLCNLIHSYTLECGLHFSNELSRIALPSSETTSNWFEDQVSDVTSDIYKNSPTYYTIEIYENLGKSMLISILDTFEKNPCSRIPAGTLESLRKDIAAKIIKIPRFWKEANIKKKCLKINEVIKETFYDEFYKRNVFNIPLSSDSRNVLSVRRNILALAQGPSTTKALKKSLTSSSQTKTRNFRTSVTTECNLDENQEEAEQQQQQQQGPRLRTLLSTKEYRLRNTAGMKFPQFERFYREECMTASEKRNPIQTSVRISDKGILLVPEGSKSQSRAIRSPGRPNLMIKDE